MGRKSKDFALLGCVLYCICISLCSLLNLFTVGFTHLTESGRQLIFPLANSVQIVVHVFLWVLSLLECVKNWKRGILCLPLCFLYSAIVIPGRGIYLVEIVLFAILSNLSTRKAAGYTWLITHFVYLGILITFLHRGLVEDVIMMNYKTFLPVEMGHSFGMGHPNGIGILILSSTLAGWFLIKPKKWWITLILFELMAMITLFISLSRTSSILLAVFPFIVLFTQGTFRIMENRKRTRILLFAVLPVLMVIITLLLGVYGDRLPGLDSNFTWRFSDYNAVQTMGLTPWGHESLREYGYYLDNLYLWMLMYCGVIPFVLMMLYYIFMQAYLAKKGQQEMLAITATYLIYGLMENAGAYLAFFFVPVLMFSTEKIHALTIQIPEENNLIRKFCSSLMGKITIFTVAFALLTASFYWIVAEDWSRTAVETDSVSADGLIPVNENDQLQVAQSFSGRMNRLLSFSLLPGRMKAELDGTVKLRITREGNVLWQKEMKSEQFQFDQMNMIDVDADIELRQEEPLWLEIDASGTGISFQRGKTVSTGRYDIQVQSAEELIINGVPQEGILVFSVRGENLISAHKWIIPGAFVLYIACLGMGLWASHQKKTGRLNAIGKFADIAHRYGYLLKTLVLRDFKIKYQSSILGVLWSFLNPLLTMTVYLFVFSMIFRSNISNFPVYLLSGIVLFNYFSESTSLGLLSIVGNRTLITKVYMPKYIYPLAKVLSSAVNLVISFIPLFIVILVTGLPIHKSILLLPFVVVFLIMLCTGMALILSTLNVFFRDIQFLWGIVLTIMNFLTPIFYPESIIPARFLPIYHLNPLYQVIFFMRSIIIGGVSPTPITYLYCIILCGVPLLAGIWFFHKKQDQFVLYL